MTLIRRVGRWLIGRIDAILIRMGRIHSFTDDPACILRIGLLHCDQPIRFEEGVTLRQRDRLIGIHLWNERLALLDSGRDTLGKGRQLLAAFTASLHMLADAIQARTIPGSPKGLRGEFGFTEHAESARRVFEQIGWTVKVGEDPGLRIWRRSFWDNVYAWMLMWTYGPHSLKGKRLSELKRIEIWMSIEAFTQRFGAQALAAAEEGQEPRMRDSDSKTGP